MIKKSVYGILRDLGISSEIAEKANNEIYEQVITPLNNEIEELNKDVEYQASQRQTAEERIKKLSTANRKKSFTGNFEADVGEAIRRNLRITHDDDTNSIHIFWNDQELD